MAEFGIVALQKDRLALRQVALEELQHKLAPSGTARARSIDDINNEFIKK